MTPVDVPDIQRGSTYRVHAVTIGDRPLDILDISHAMWAGQKVVLVLAHFEGAFEVEVRIDMIGPKDVHLLAQSQLVQYARFRGTAQVPGLETQAVEGTLDTRREAFDMGSVKFV